MSTTQAGVTTTYGHDAYFRRATQQRAGSPLELYLYEGPNVAAVASGAGIASVERRFVYDGVDHPLWMWDRVADAGVYFELDCIGNVRRLRGGARYGAGAALPSDLGGYKYSAFGRSIAADAGTPAPVVDGSSFAQPLRWQGRWLDTATGIYDVRNRQWSPELGAFLSADEFVFHTSPGTLWSWPGQNPSTVRDPSGRFAPLLIIGGAAILLGGGWLYTEFSSFQVIAINESARLYPDTSQQLPGGERDAFRHCMGACMASDVLGPTGAQLALDAREEWSETMEGHPGNQCAMDKENNAVGATLAARGANTKAKCSARCAGAVGLGIATTLQ